MSNAALKSNATNKVARLFQGDKKYVTFAILLPMLVPTALANTIEKDLYAELYWNFNIAAKECDTDVDGHRITIRSKLYGAGVELVDGQPPTSAYNRAGALEALREVVSHHCSLAGCTHARASVMDGDTPKWELFAFSPKAKVLAAVGRVPGLKRLVKGTDFHQK